MEDAFSAFAGLSWPVLVAGPAVCFVAAALGGMSGMGSGLMITLFITPIVGPKAVLPVISVLMLITNASRLWFLRGALEPRRVALISAVAVPFAAIGALVYVRLDSDAVRVLLGAVLVGSVPLRRWVEHKKLVPGPGAIVGVSAAYGFLGSIVVGAGMLIIPLLMGAGLAGAALLATDAAIAVILNLAKAVFFGRLDALTWPLFVAAVAMGLFTVPGTWLAAWIVRRTSVRIHTLFIEALLVLGGFVMILGWL
ncbi:MAG TPA: TSUP family transporter [Afifellaceae bacterium]|nr:TSUP family transporter [Afifellaceae bacterium]